MTRHFSPVKTRATCVSSSPVSVSKGRRTQKAKQKQEESQQSRGNSEVRNLCAYVSELNGSFFLCMSVVVTLGTLKQKTN